MPLYSQLRFGPKEIYVLLEGRIPAVHHSGDSGIRSSKHVFGIICNSSRSCKHRPETVRSSSVILCQELCALAVDVACSRN